MNGRFLRGLLGPLVVALLVVAPAAAPAQPPGMRVAVLAKPDPVPGYVASIAASYASPPDAARQACITSLVRTLYQSDAWSRIDILYVFAAGEDQGSRVNWKTPGTWNAGKTGTGGTFITDQGWGTFSSGNSLTAGFDPSTAGAKFLRNDAHFFVGTLTDAAEANNVTWLAGTSQARIQPRNFSGNWASGSNSSATDTIAANTGKGLYGWSRSVSTAYTPYKNGSAQSAVTRSSIALPTATFLIGTNDATNYTSKVISLVSIGGGLSDAQAVSVWTAYSGYMTCIGQSAT